MQAGRAWGPFLDFYVYFCKQGREKTAKGKEVRNLSPQDKRYDMLSSDSFSWCNPKRPMDSYKHP